VPYLVYVAKQTEADGLTNFSYFSDFKSIKRAMMIIAALTFGVSSVASAHRSAEETAYRR